MGNSRVEPEHGRGVIVPDRKDEHVVGAEHVGQATLCNGCQTISSMYSNSRDPLFWKERSSPNAVFWASHHEPVIELVAGMPVMLVTELGMSLPPWT